MPFDLDPLLLSRIQFAFTIAFHIVFPAFTIGLASFLVVVEALWLKTGRKLYQSIYRMWIKVFAIAFGLGVVSGVVMSYQFGTNWSEFSQLTGNVLGPLLGYEVLTAFFLEASFLGVMLFGWGRVSPRMHFAATVIVAVGTLISAFWILSANSWMHTPQGHRIDANGVFFPTDWWAIVFNPSFPHRFLHMVVAAYLTTAFAVGGVAAAYLLQGRFVRRARIMLGMALLMAVFVAPVQLVIGDFHGLNTLEHQPAKVAAMEGIWDDERGAALRLLAWPDQATQSNRFEITVPKLASLILTHSTDGEIKGLKNWAPADQPPVAPVFFAFRVMVGIGIAMILTGLMAVWLHLRKRLFTQRLFLRWCVLMSPSGFIAILAGWVVTEVGRQPWTVYGLLRTADSASPLIGEQVGISLLAFVAVYTALFGTGVYYIFNLLSRGPAIVGDGEKYYDHSKSARVTERLAGPEKRDD